MTGPSFTSAGAELLCIYDAYTPAVNYGGPDSFTYHPRAASPISPLCNHLFGE